MAIPGIKFSHYVYYLLYKCHYEVHKIENYIAYGLF